MYIYFETSGFGSTNILII